MKTFVTVALLRTIITMTIVMLTVLNIRTETIATVDPPLTVIRNW